MPVRRDEILSKMNATSEALARLREAMTGLSGSPAQIGSVTAALETLRGRFEELQSEACLHFGLTIEDNEIAAKLVSESIINMEEELSYLRTSLDLYRSNVSRLKAV